jgi:putative Mn2+ efflux pump MntP
MATLLFLAFALAADAFAASLIQGVAARVDAWRVAVRCGVAFGLAQGLMPLIGWGGSVFVADSISAYDHWIAFGVLALLGGKLIKEGLTEGPEDAAPARPASSWLLFGLALATSLDAAAAGLAFTTLGVAPLFACAVIAIITGVLCFGGVLIGARLGPALGPKAEVIGGVALIGIGVKVLFDHGALAWPM